MGTTVLGNYPGYIALSDDLGARRFDIFPAAWQALYVQGGRAFQWNANCYFLALMNAANDRFVFSSDPRLARPGSWFFQELRYLRSCGVSLTSAAKNVWVP